MSAFSFCGVLLDTQSDFQIVIERICDGVNISILAGVSLTLLVGDDGCVIYDMVYTNIHGQFVVAVFSGTIFENIRTINDRAVGIHTTLMREVLFADMQNYDVPKLHKRIYYDRDKFISDLPEPLRTNFAAGIHDKIMNMDEYFQLVEGICEDLADDIKAGWTEVQLHPNGGQWCSDEALLQMKEYALEHGMYIHLHLLETQYQAEYAKRTWGKSFIKHYKEIGFLGPWVSFAHAVWLDEEDLQLIAESGAHLITNPSSNLRLRSGIFNMQRANELGIDCGIGLDGCAFDDDQDYLREIRVAWLNNLHNGVDGEVDYKDVLKMATSRGAKISACGLSSGFLEPGGTADFTMISVDSIEKPYADSGIDPLALLVQRGTRQSVIMTCVNGKIAWQQNDESRKKEKDAEIQICTAIKELRAKDDGKRDNSIVLQHVHDFYTKRK